MRENYEPGHVNETFVSSLAEWMIAIGAHDLGLAQRSRQAQGSRQVAQTSRRKDSRMSAENKRVSPGNSDDKLAKAVDNGQHAMPQTNLERLIAHLAKDKLAAKLVSAYSAPGESTPADAVTRVATDRLDELKRNYDKPEDQQG